MANNYHNEALRKQRMIERKNEAIARLNRQGIEPSELAVANSSSKLELKDVVHTTDECQFTQQRSSKSYQPHSSAIASEEGVLFGEVIHDPNFKFRILKSGGNAPVHVDNIYKIMYPDSYRHECEPY